jgi:hypothetical protein
MVIDMPTLATLNLNFLVPTMPSYVTFTRANATATRINSAGLSVMCAANEPRFTYDQVTRAPKGLLIEGARTNLLVNSVLAGGTTPTSWTLAGTGTPAVAASIYGSGDGAIAISFTASTSQQYLTQTVAGVASTTYSASVRVEATSGLTISQMLHAVNGTATVTIVSYVVNGVVGTSSSVPVVGDRIHITYTLSGTGNCALRYGAGTTSNSTGTVTLSRTQDEVGAMPSSFIPTTTAAVARAADLPVITGTEATSRINTAAGTMFAEFTFEGGSSAIGADGRHIMSIDNGGANDRHQLYNYNGGVGAFGSNSGTIYSIAAGAGNPAISAGSVARVASRYNDSSFNIASNGVSGTQDSTGTPSPNVNSIKIGSAYTSGAQLFGCIRRAILFSTALSDPDLSAMTVAGAQVDFDIIPCSNSGTNRRRPNRRQQLART